MTSTEEPPRRGRGRPRSPGAEQKILHAALEEYTEHGWAGFTMDGVARRAGFGKSTLYLRWDDKDALLTDAVRRRHRPAIEVDTGSLRGDLTALAVAVFGEFADPEGWAGFRMVVDTASASEPLGQFTREVSGVHRRVLEGILGRARDRDELATEVEPLLLADLLYGAGLFYALGHRLDNRPVTAEELSARVDAVVTILLRGLG
jgi:AcrR family transcriptional regulator